MGVELEWVMLSSVGHRKQKEIGLGKKKEERLRENYKEVRHCATTVWDTEQADTLGRGSRTGPHGRERVLKQEAAGRRAVWLSD